MLATNKQHGTSACLAFALWNLGVIDEETTKTYTEAYQPLVERSKEAFTDEARNGALLFQQEWAEHIMPALAESMRRVQGNDSWFSPFFTLNGMNPPETGKAVLIIRFTGLLGMGFGHAVAFENGLVSDSQDDEQTSPEPFNVWKERLNSQGWKVEVVDVVPIP